LEAQSLLKGSSHFESYKNGAKNVRRHFSFKYILKIGDSDQKNIFFR
jgi:hypothetical protein